MELKHDFKVGVPVDVAWRVLTDVERIAPCLPGAELQEVEGTEYRGVVKVKVGPISAQYKGKATFTERDDAAHKAVVKAEGRDTRGQGNASALITASLVPDGDGTAVSIVTNLTVTGRVAQLGRGVMADVSAKLLGQFVTCLESEVLSGASPRAAEAGEAPEQREGPAVQDGPASAGGGARRIDSRPAQPVDLLATAGTPVLKRLVPTVVALVLVILLLRRLRAAR
jgi:hypothetical protein